MKKAITLFICVHMGLFPAFPGTARCLAPPCLNTVTPSPVNARDLRHRYRYVRARVHRQHVDAHPEADHAHFIPVFHRFSSASFFS